MSLAPARSRGAFLKARLAVNGIQCAARSFGTLTAAGLGLLSSMGDLFKLGHGGFCGKLSASLRHGNAMSRTICRQSGGLREFGGTSRTKCPFQKLPGCPSCDVKLQTCTLLKITDHAEQIFGLRVSTRAEHAD